MKRKLLSTIIPFVLFLVVTSLIFSCNKNKGFDNFSIHETSPDLPSASDFNKISLLNELNNKVIDISSIIFHQNKPVPHLQLIIKIKEDHLQNDKDFKHFARRNLVVIPKTFYQLNLSKDSLGNKNSTKYLVQILINEIETQIDLLENIKTTTTNPDFKSFAEKSEILFEENNKQLKISFNF